MKLFITHERVDHAITGIPVRTRTIIDDLVKNKISLPLAEGDEGEGDR